MFGNEVLIRSVVGVILGNIGPCVNENYFELALGHANELLAKTDLYDSEVDVPVTMEALEEACSEVVRTAREAAARQTAFSALEQRLSELDSR